MASAAGVSPAIGLSPTAEAGIAGHAPISPPPAMNAAAFILSSPFAPDGTGVKYGGPNARHLASPVPSTKPLFVNARTGAQLSHQRLHADAIRYASGFRNTLGLLPTPMPGSAHDTSPVVSPVVLLHSPNCLAFVPILLGAIAAQLTVNMANPGLTSTEISSIIAKCRPSVIVTANLPAIQEAVASLNDPVLAYRYQSDRVYVIDLAADDYGLDRKFSRASFNINGWRVADHKTLLSDMSFRIASMTADETNRRIAVLLNSSGTGGKSKMVMQPHVSLVWTVISLFHANSFGSDERWLGFAPFYHVFGLSTILAHGIAIGATTFVMPAFDVAGMLRLVPKQRITHLHMAPPVGVILAKSPLVEGVDWSSCKDATSGGAPLGLDVITAVYKRLGMMIRMGYGTSEACSTCTTEQPSWLELQKVLGSTGHPHIGVQLKVIATDGSDRTLGREQEGEILIKSQSSFLGYYGDPVTTAATLRPNGWQHTGDVGKLDVAGNLWITDRLKDVMKVKGFQVSPAELEDCLMSSEDVLDAGVTSIYSEEDASEYPRAYVVPKDPELLEALVQGKPSARAATIAECIKQHTESKLIHYKHLRGGLVFLSRIPKSPTGKLLRRDFHAQRGIEVALYRKRSSKL